MQNNSIDLNHGRDDTPCHTKSTPLNAVRDKAKRDIGLKSRFFDTHLHSMPPLRGFPSKYCHKVWYGKTRMVWLPQGKKKSLRIVSTEYTNVANRQTQHADMAALKHSVARKKTDLD